MIKAGLVGAMSGFIYMMSLTLVSPFCTLCLTPLLGIGVGYLASRFDKPQELQKSLIAGGIAGGITGIAALLGQMLATVVNGVLVTRWEQLPLYMEQLGLSELPDAGEYWQTMLIANSFCSLLNLVLIVILGVLGSLIWFRRHKQKEFSIVV